MAVRIRLARLGRRHRPFFRINAVDSRTPRDGRILEKLGHYDPLEKDTGKQVVIDLQKTQAWLEKGAIPSDGVIPILKRLGLTCTYMEEKHTRQIKARTLARKQGKPFTKAEKIAAGHVPSEESK
ncbi:MAG: 30S ribosomal protein S16 [Sedimentisphaerales bacterium]|nr:30S ribosomal protein S16 [Sedimentisphaerales bacterium]